MFLIDFYIISEAIATVVTIAEILKNNGLAVEKSEILAPFSKPLFLSITYETLNLLWWNTIYTEIMTSTVDMREDAGGRPIQKAKVDCVWYVRNYFSVSR